MPEAPRPEERALAAEPVARSFAARGRIRGDAIALLLVAAVLAAFFAPAILGSDQFLYRDAGRMHWPIKRWVAQELRQGHLPQWNPYLGLGVPLVAGAVDAVQHPFNLLLVALPFEVGFKLWVLLSYVVAATGGYAWARRLARSRPASVAAGLSFALSGFLVSSSDNLTYLTTLAALPWLFAAAHGWLERGGPGRLALVGLASACCAAGGDPQAWGFAVVSLPPYAALVCGGDRGAAARVGRGVAAAAAAFVGAAPFILPVLAWIPHSSRGAAVGASELARWSLPPLRLLELALPHMFRDQDGVLGSWVYIAFGGGELTPIPWVLSIYVGVSVVALAIVGALRSREARWLVLGALVLAWTALGIHGGFGRLLPHLPVLRGFRYWEKMVAWPTLLLAMASAYGIDALAEGAATAHRRFCLGVGAAIAVALAALGTLTFARGGVARLLAPRPGAKAAAPFFASAADAFVENLRSGLGEAAAICAALVLVVWAARRQALRPHLGALLALVVVFDAAAANVRGYTLASPFVVETRAPFGDYLRAEPGLQRVFTRNDLSSEGWHALRELEASWIRASHLLEASLNVSYRVGNFFAYTGMIPARTDRFQLRAGLQGLVPHVGVLGVGYFAVPTVEQAREYGLAPPYSVAAVDPLLPALLLRIPHRERAYLAAEVDPVDRRQAMEFLLAADPARTDRSVVEGPVPAGYRPPRGTARIVSDLPERVAVETESDGHALLVLNDVQAAGWRANVDGAPAEILPANYMARGVWVIAGKHVVTFTYRTPWLREGWLTFLAGAAGLGVAAVRRRLTGRPATRATRSACCRR